VGHVLQDAVAHLVAEGVVHRLEAVEVQQQQGMLAAIVRGDQVVLPRGEDAIEAGDTVIAFCLHEAASGVERLFA